MHESDNCTLIKLSTLITICHELELTLLNCIHNLATFCVECVYVAEVLVILVLAAHYND